jgi:hypothetical protein
MKRGGLGTVFGLPTLLTVLIVMSVLGFASLSVMTTAAQHRGVLRSLDLMEESYTALAEAQTRQLELTTEFETLVVNLAEGADQSAMITSWAQSNGLTLDPSSSTVTLLITTDSLTVKTVLWISPTHTLDNVRLLAQTLTIDNDQDYTQDGDPIWKGPQ